MSAHKISHWALVVPLLLAAFALRVHYLTHDRFHADEALYAGWALRILDDDPLLLDEPVDKPPLYLYLLAASMRVLGRSEVGARVPNLCASMLNVALLYRLARRLYGPRTARWAAFLGTCSPLAILFARTAFTDPLLVTWMLVALCALAAPPRDTRWAAAARYAGAGLAAGLAFATKQHAVLLLPFPLALIWARWGSMRRRRWLLAALPGLALPVGLVTWWDAQRWAIRPGFWQQSALSYGGLGWAPVAEWGARGIEWLGWARYLVGAPLLYGLLILGAVALLARIPSRPRAPIPSRPSAPIPSRPSAPRGDDQGTDPSPSPSPVWRGGAAPTSRRRRPDGGPSGRVSFRAPTLEHRREQQVPLVPPLRGGTTGARTPPPAPPPLASRLDPARGADPVIARGPSRQRDQDACCDDTARALPLRVTHPGCPGTRSGVTPLADCHCEGACFSRLKQSPPLPEEPIVSLAAGALPGRSRSIQRLLLEAIPNHARGADPVIARAPLSAPEAIPNPARGPSRSARLDVALIASAAAYLVAHIVLGFSIWDRYLLPLVPVASMLLARVVVRARVWACLPRAPAARRWARRAALLLAALVAASALLSGLRAARNGYPVGGEHWAYQGLDQVAAYLQAHAAPDAVLYHHWLRWHYTYYLHGAPYELRWWASGEHLQREAARSPTREQYIVLPDWRTLEPDAAGLRFELLLETRRDDNSISLQLYRIHVPEPRAD
ncbi:MAG: glycosyltransferase family 39 protein [Anaerolineae bacterium]|nr:glycosyltransferase family 39 protein [Anaerolineae bacterium]